ncbi:hypothetical protein QE152_g38742 [Popillia japonica]|uniref:Uncharacterized protein n=1 Tax=Popillia japonica TaxID=7064 RepID=A0AAW1HWP2_POPJA
MVSTSYDVVATVSNLGGGNVGLYRELKVDIDKTWFPHPMVTSNFASYSYYVMSGPSRQKLVNDCFNVKVSETDKRDRTNAYSLATEVQNEILDKMASIMRTLESRVVSLYLKRLYAIEYILSNRLNQDVPVNFFSVLPAKGGLHNHPDTIEFRYRLRSYIMGKNEGSPTIAGNVEADHTADLAASDTNLE